MTPRPRPNVLLEAGMALGYTETVSFWSRWGSQIRQRPTRPARCARDRGGALAPRASTVSVNARTTAPDNARARRVCTSCAVQGRCSRFLQRMLLDQKTLALVSLARSAEADHHCPKLARRLGWARERGIAAAEEDEVVQLGAGEAERSWPLHDEQLPGALAPRQVQSLSGEMTTTSFMSGGDDKRAQWPKT